MDTPPRPPIPLHEGCGLGRIWVDGRGLLRYTGRVAPEPTDDPTIDRLVCPCGWTMRARRVGHRN